MDPSARRYLWTVIKKARDSGMTIVLTTHRFEINQFLLKDVKDVHHQKIKKHQKYFLRAFEI